MNKDLRWKVARMILDKSRAIGDVAEVQKHFKGIGFERSREGLWMAEDGIPWQATPANEGPHLLFKPEGDRLYFQVTAPMLSSQAVIMETTKENAEKILVLGMP